MPAISISTQKDICRKSIPEMNSWNLPTASYSLQMAFHFWRTPQHKHHPLPTPLITNLVPLTTFHFIAERLGNTTKALQCLKRSPLYSKMEGIFKPSYLWQWCYVLKIKPPHMQCHGTYQHLDQNQSYSWPSTVCQANSPWSFSKNTQSFVRLFGQLNA